jgi:hypothetical protein
VAEARDFNKAADPYSFELLDPDVKKLSKTSSKLIFLTTSSFLFPHEKNISFIAVGS